MIVNDDCSSDGTIDIVRTRSAEYGIPTKILESNISALGAVKNFEKLLSESDAPYFMLCDQDDIWRADKIEVLLTTMMNAEESEVTETPVLIHSDLRVVDEDLHEICSSFWRYQDIWPQYGATFEKQLTQNSVTGCALIGNAALRSMTGCIPDDAIMHDWWLALVASGFGRIHTVPHALVDYRQHNANTIGANDSSLFGVAMNCKTFTYYKECLAMTYRQAKKFAEIYGDDLSLKKKRIVKTYSSFPEKGFFEKRLDILLHGYYKSGILRNAAYLLLV